MALNTVIVRDDDICYFTDVKRFAIVHRFLLNRNLPFNIAAIPLVSDQIAAANGKIEGFIPIYLQNKGRQYEFTRAKDLIDFISTKPEIDIAQHGYKHVRLVGGLPEFAGNDARDIYDRLIRGKVILTQAFGREPRFFVPPYDTISRLALSVIKDHYRGISLSRYNHSVLPPQQWLNFYMSKFLKKYRLNWGDFILLSHPDSDFFLRDKSFAIADVPVKDIIVVTLHSWMFFNENGKLKQELLQKYEDLLATLITIPGVQFKRFSDL